MRFFHRFICLEIIRLIAGGPFYVAADGWGLVYCYRCARKHLIGGRTQIIAGYGLVVAGAACVELAPVHKLLRRVEQKKIRCAGGFVGFGHLLCFVKHIGERVPELCGIGLHVLRPVLWMGLQAVGIDGNHTDLSGHILVGIVHQGLFQVFYVGAVVAYEHNQQSLCLPKGVQRDGFTAGNVLKGKIWSRGTQLEHG